MTVVAWDGKTLAVDRQATSGHMISKHTKIFKCRNDYVAAFWGPIGEYGVLIDWLESGAIPKDWPKLSEDVGVLIVSGKDGSALEYEGTGYPIPIEVPFYAWGQGRELAMGAMAAGADAIQAVRIANQHSAHCGCGIDAWDLETKEIRSVE